MPVRRHPEGSHLPSDRTTTNTRPSSQPPPLSSRRVAPSTNPNSNANATSNLNNLSNVNFHIGSSPGPGPGLPTRPTPYSRHRSQLRDRPMERPIPIPTVATESSTRRNTRLTLLAARRRTGTSLQTTPTNFTPNLNRSTLTPASRPGAIASGSEPNNPNHNQSHQIITSNRTTNGAQRISFSEYANSLSTWLNTGATARGTNSSLSSRDSPPRLALSQSRSRSPPRTRTFANSRTRSRSSRTRVNFEIIASSLGGGQKIITSVTRVMENGDKYLPKIFRLLNWNELLPARLVSKRWLEVISMSPISNQLGTIVIRNPWETILQTFIDSPVIWTKFRLDCTMFVDMMDGVQLEFWMKHGPQMQTLEIDNRALTVTGLVDILTRCPNLSHLIINWTPEMYPFNSELIKKYYGLSFYNGSFPNMHELSVKKSCHLNDNALMSLLKWCGGTLKSLSLTYPPKPEQDPLTKLKPRWTISPLENYIERFGYTGNLHQLDFSWSNISPTDLKVLASLSHLSRLRRLSLNHCRVDDASLTHFLEVKGHLLHTLELEDVPVTEAIFGATSNTNSNAHAHAKDTNSNTKECPVPYLHILNISGPRGDYKQLGFLLHMPQLEELKASGTHWLHYNKLMPLLKAKGVMNSFLKAVDISGGVKVNGAKQVDVNMNRVWFTNLSTALAKVTRLNLGNWSQFGKNENFRTICTVMKELKELRLRGWRELNDSGVTGFPSEKLHGNKKIQILPKDLERVYIGVLKGLEILDLSGCNVSDATVKYGTVYLPNLRKFAFDNTEISDVGISYVILSNHSLDKISFKKCHKIMEKKAKFERSDGRYIYSGTV